MLVIGNGRMITRDASSAFFFFFLVAMDGNTIKMVGVTDEVEKTLWMRTAESLCPLLLTRMNISTVPLLED